MMWFEFPAIIFAVLNFCVAVQQQPFVIEREASDKNFHFFPKSFSFGASTAGKIDIKELKVADANVKIEAFQIEGGWNADGKGPSIWDNFVHAHPEWIADHTNADVGPDSYHFYKKDVEALKHVGVNTTFIHIRFHVDKKVSFVSSVIIVSQFHGRDFFHRVRRLTRKRLIITIN